MTFSASGLHARDVHVRGGDETGDVLDRHPRRWHVVTTTIVATNGNAKGQVRNEVRVTSTTLDSNTVNNSSTISLKLR